MNDILNNATVKVLSTRDSASLIDVDAGKYNSYETLVNININPTDVTDIANNLTVKVLSTRDSASLIGVDVGKYFSRKTLVTIDRLILS